MVFADSHTHSYLSFDGDAASTPDAMCQKAVSLGLTDLAITDHFDTNAREMGYGIPDDLRMEEEILSCKEKYKKDLHVSYGVELGEPFEYPDRANDLMARHNFDFVIGSIHNLPGLPDFALIPFGHSEYTDEKIRSLFEQTIKEMIRVIEYPGIHTLAHITYMERYLRKAGRKLATNEFREQIADLFKALITKGIALELNVSPLARGDNYTMPDISLLRLYAGLGGELVTVGSDAHKLEQIGKGIKEGYALLEATGIRYVTVFRDGKPNSFHL
ncbi:MAG: histidinol-phosphatase HisJ family protein [Clostridia bacterium]|nr:histidinol-phosphatase HisJ family protein [Clostridia bacterium]